MKRIVTTLAALLLAAPMFAGPVALEWDAVLEDARPARFTVVRGDTVELAARLFAEGRPYLPDAADASLLWQTNGMGALWWEAPASVSSNRVSATWTPAMDPGAPSYLAHFRVGSGTGSVFRAYARLSMQHGPGDPPNALPLPVPVIDFAKVAVTNAPWGASGLTTNDVRAIVEEDESIVRQDQGGNSSIEGEFSARELLIGSRAVVIGELEAGSNVVVHSRMTAREVYIGDAPAVDDETLNAATDWVARASVSRTNLPPVSSSATVGELVDSVNAVIRAMRKEGQ